MKHTPGKWTLELRDKSLPKAAGGHHTIRVDNRLIATVPAYRLGGSAVPLCLEECEANARLMAAAPELLKAVRFLAEFCCLGDHKFKNDPEIEKVYQAIAKAEGRDK